MSNMSCSGHPSSDTLLCQHFLMLWLLLNYFSPCLNWVQNYTLGCAFREVLDFVASCLDVAIISPLPHPNQEFFEACPATKHGIAFNSLYGGRFVRQSLGFHCQHLEIMFILVNQSWPTPLNHQWGQIFSEISSAVIETGGGCVLSVFLVFTRATSATVQYFSSFFFLHPRIKEAFLIGRA